MELDDTTITDDFGGMTFTNGVATFTLKDGESMTATGLPAGVGYTVTETEANADGYTTEYSSQTGTIPADGSNAEVTVTNTRQTGDLVVSKTLGGSYGETDKAWTFTVTLSDTSINGIYGEMEFTNGVATFTLKGGESKAATGLPTGVTYTVTEEPDDNYTCNNPDGLTGFIAEGTATAAFTNTRKTGGLTVQKTVAGPGDTTKNWNFTVELDDTTITDDFGGMTFTDGVATFTLKDGESKTATGLPSGVGYTVTETEANADGYTTEYSSQTGTIPADGSNAEVTVTNTRQTGDLVVSKIVTGTLGDLDKEWTFTVTLSDTTITGDFGDMEFTDGVATFTLKSGEKMTAIGLPSGVTYTVTETEANADGYLTTPSGANGIIPNGGEVEAHFINERPEPDVGNLTITKVVDGGGDEATNKTFTFTVAGPNGYSETVTITGNGSETLNDLPVGTYTVTEDSDGAAVKDYDLNVTGEGEATITTDTTTSVIVTNTYTSIIGDLTVTKTVTGSGDTTKDWHFTVTLSDTTISGTYGDMTFTDGVAEFTLKHGESETAIGLPSGVTYTVTETEANADGYLTTPSGANGTIPNGGEVEAHFINERPEPDVGNLTITKVVDGGGDEATNKTFTFTVSGPNGYSETVTITGNGSETLNDLPVGTYTVTEDSDGAAVKDYDLNVTGEGEVTITTDATTSVTVTNTYTSIIGDLTVTKTVTGSGDTTKDWHFTVTLSDTTISGTYGGMTFTDGVAEFTLKHGESITATDLPTGVAFTVTEEEADQDGYTTTATGAMGTIPSGGTALVAFVNNKATTPPPPSRDYGNLVVTKTVTGDNGEMEREWHFRVELSDTGINGQYGDMFFTGGVAEFTLKHGQSATAQKLPVGVTYTVTEIEENQDGYDTTYTNDKGTIISEQDIVAAFINDNPAKAQDDPDNPPDDPDDPTENPPDNPTDNPDNPTDNPSDNPDNPPDTPTSNNPDDTPKTGDESHLALWFSLMILSLIGIMMTVLTLIIGRKKLVSTNGRHMRK